MKKVLAVLMMLTLVLGFLPASVAADETIASLGSPDLAYKWYSDDDAQNGMITESPDHLLDSPNDWEFDFDGEPGFKSVMRGECHQYTYFDAGLQGGARLTIIWTPGYSAKEQLKAVLDNQEIEGRLISATAGNNQQSDAQQGAPESDPLWYFTEVFEFEPLDGESHKLAIWSLMGDGVGFDYVELEAISMNVDIDIKPGSDPNSFNINGHGVIPVALLGSEEFDVRDVDLSTLDFEGFEVRVRGGKNAVPQCSYEDVNSDNYEDLVCQFEDDASTWVEGEDYATLSGNLNDGTPFEGTDTINIVPPEK